ncbi:MAG: S-layer homology domain-containing protein, partial [Nitriliruptoraceae bacterium]
MTAGADGRGGGGGGGDTREDARSLDLCPEGTTAAPQPGGSGVVLVRYLADDLATVTDVTATAERVEIGQEATVTVTVADVDGAAAQDVPVSLSAEPGDAPDAVRTGEDGRATFTVSRDTAGTVTYTATLDGVETDHSIEVDHEEPAEQPLTGTLITEEPFTTSMPGQDAGWRFRSGPPEHPDDRDYPSIRDGHLRLVPAEANWSGSAIYEVPQPTSAGLDVSFRTQQDGGTGADGLAFFLADGATVDIVPGSSGGRLGFVNLAGDGGAGALLGIGLDTYGNFAAEQTDDCSETYGPTAHALTIRGGPTDDWCVLHAPVVVGGGWGPERLVRIQVDPADDPSPQVRVSVDGTEVAELAQPTALRDVDLFTFGFTASTGGSHNDHDIWDVEVRSLVELGEVSWTTGADLPTATFGEAYEVPLVVADAVRPVAISLVDGALPPGLSLGDGVITGTPTSAATSTFTLEVADSRASSSTATQEFTLTVEASEPTVSTSTPVEVSATSALLQATVVDDGGTAVTERGFLVEPLTGATSARTIDAPLQGAFEVAIDGLEPRTTYQVRAYATNDAGTSRAAPVTFTTLEPPPAPDPDPAPASEPEPVRDEAGALPLPGMAEAEVEGEPVEVVAEPTATSGSRITGSGFVLEVTPRASRGEGGGDGDEDAGGADGDDGAGGADGDDGEGAPGGSEGDEADDVEDDASDADLVFTRGQAAEVRVVGFRPRSPVRLWLFSEPEPLGEFETDAGGGLEAITEELGDHVSACRHTLHAEGVLPDGRTVRLSLGVWVDAEPYPFPDVSATSVHRRAIACLYDEGIVRGRSAAEFDPSGTTTRGQTASLFVRWFDLEAAAAPTHRDAVGTTHAAAIAALVEAGAAHGYDADTFGPDRPITRGQFASMLAALLELTADGRAGVGVAAAASDPAGALAVTSPGREGGSPSGPAPFPDVAGVQPFDVEALVLKA